MRTATLLALLPAVAATKGVVTLDALTFDKVRQRRRSALAPSVTPLRLPPWAAISERSAGH